MKSENELLEIRNLAKKFVRNGEIVEAITKIDIAAIRRKEFLCIVGPSGCGKTTFLRILAGLETPDKGEIIYKNIEDKTSLKTTLLFQEFALFPWLKVKSNVEFGLADNEKGAELNYIKDVGLSGWEDNYPNDLSRGMQQRVALARALAYKPQLLLMDEPFGSVDAQTKEILKRLLIRIWKEYQITIIFVTHSIEEALFLGDRIIVLTKRPARIKKEFIIDLKHPRDSTSQEFNILKREISDILFEEVGVSFNS
jgi:NitT/TauT family transport system ATP-binding protein